MNLPRLSSCLINHYELADGNMVSIHDSGGERQLIIDIADQQGVEFAELEDSTTQKLKEILDPGLPLSILLMPGAKDWRCRSNHG